MAERYHRTALQSGLRRGKQERCMPPGGAKRPLEGCTARTAHLEG